MKQTLTFNPSIIGSTASKLNVDAWDIASDAYDKKEYLKSFHALLDYINPDIRVKYGNANDSEYSIPHGSVIVNIKVDTDTLKISAPFLKIPETNRVPLLRQTASLNFRNIDLAQIELKDGQLQFEYSCPMALADPYKMYYVFREICYTGDKYDDEFATKFGAERIYEPKITPYNAATVDTVYNTIQSSCKECMEGLKYYENERKYGYAWNVVACTILKILYYAHPQGQLLNDLNKTVYELDREDIPLSEVVNIGKREVERLQGMTKEQLAEDLYFVEMFVSPKRRSSLKNIQDNFENTYKKVTNYIEQEDYMAVAVMVTYSFYNMYFYNNVQDDVNNLVVNAMTESSAKPWHEAAPILYKAMDKIMNGNLSAGSGGGFKKFLGGLFGGK
ncbi:YbjN domain-containing protein [Dysgonomonas sp. 25]|uniref:YbjN domain-containing protein n=1 Tax=Dysgonomonas sp. 25 TaxID=2302933 RepID=UPI0013D70385|nr:YbjN domain-containing protein [Dysgonomonas sp. 25]NDV67642.1 hypothetical protein [Dysgonomonas sp. 25]